MKRVDLVVAAVFFLMGCWVLWQATMLPQFSVFGPGPEFMPNVLGILLLVLSATLFVSTLRKARGEGAVLMPSPQGIYRIAIIIVALFAYVALVEAVGYLLITFVYVTFMLFALGKYRWYTNLVLAVTITALFYWSFVSLLGVPAPKGIFSL